MDRFLIVQTQDEFSTLSHLNDLKPFDIPLSSYERLSSCRECSNDDLQLMNRIQNSITDIQKYLDSYHDGIHFCYENPLMLFELTKLNSVNNNLLNFFGTT